MTDRPKRNHPWRADLTLSRAYQDQCFDQGYDDECFAPAIDEDVNWAQRIMERACAR